MLIKKSFLFLTLSMAFYFQSFSGEVPQERVSGKPIYNKITGEKIDESKISELRKSPNGFVLESVIDKYGNVESFLYDPDKIGNSVPRDFSKRTKAGEPFTPFILKSINGGKIDSEKLRGKIILIQFILLFQKPFFNEARFKQFESLRTDSLMPADLETIVITESSEEEIKECIDIKKYKTPIVPDGRNFSIRFLIRAFPSMILIDKEGKLIYYFEDSNDSKLFDEIKKRFPANK